MENRCRDGRQRRQDVPHGQVWKWWPFKRRLSCSNVSRLAQISQISCLLDSSWHSQYVNHHGRLLYEYLCVWWIIEDDSISPTSVCTFLSTPIYLQYMWSHGIKALHSCCGHIRRWKNKGERHGEGDIGDKVPVNELHRHAGISETTWHLKLVQALDAISSKRVDNEWGNHHLVSLSTESESYEVSWWCRSSQKISNET